MPEPLDDVELERLMRETHAAIESLRAKRPSPEETTVRGEGQASDERVRASVHGGRVASVTLDPRVLRLSSEEFGGLVTEAVNAALDDQLGRSAAAAGPVPDLVALTETLRAVQNESLRQMEIITQGITDAMARIRERTRISGDPTPRGLEDLFGLTRRNLEDALTVTGDSADARGEGKSARGRIRAVAMVGRVESVTVEAQAMRMASHELAEQLTIAVNAALDDLGSKVGPGGRAGGADAEELRKRVSAAQDMSIDQMRTYTRALRDIMSSIEGPE
ncbi:hypothetical protein [Actinoallomurus sp. NPDC052274]|uniref:hypothetical protein n=1 Tax=Actinoallomurus sp. NPDC052274 TaxID=3155420 RepID=UPI003427C8EF